MSKKKAALLKRTEEAELKLQPVTQELQRLKGHITDMCISIFGKKHHNVLELPPVKLKAVYKFLEQLYVGGAKCVMSINNTKEPPRHIMDMIRELSTVPEWIQELKKEACRQGAMCSLARAKAYHPEMEPTLLADGFP